MRHLTQLIKPANVMVAVLILGAVSCLPEPAGEGADPTIEIPEDAAITLGDSALKDAQIARLRELAGDLQRTTEAVTTKPDFEFRIQAPGVKEPDVFSVWLEERFLYGGFYLDAWTERMQSDVAQGYRLDATTRQFLQELRAELEKPAAN